MQFDRQEAADALLTRQDFEPQRSEPNPLIVSIRVAAADDDAAREEARTVAGGIVGVEPTVVSVALADIVG
jgi:hypothetical protein